MSESLVAVDRVQFVFNPANYSSRQLALEQFSRVVKAAFRLDTSGTVNHIQTVLMLLELAKNTFDHSVGIGVLDMQLPVADVPLLITYLDNGEPFDWEACCAPGYSSKQGNGVNYGLGLAILQQGCNCSRMRLTVARVNDCTEFRIQGL